MPATSWGTSVAHNGVRDDSEADVFPPKSAPHPGATMNSYPGQVLPGSSYVYTAAMQSYGSTRHVRAWGKESHD